MKIGIITYWSSSNNYGQLLQCYALQRYLRDRGHDAYLIRYEYDYRKSLWERFVLTFSWTRLWKKMVRIVTRTKDLVSEENQRLVRRNEELDKQRRFEDFRREYLHSTPVLYRSIDELRANPPEAQIYVSGSDQVWNNPLSSKDTAAFFLDFGPKTVRRVAYAPSLGRSLKKYEEKCFVRYVSALDALSLREASACEYCRRLGFKEAIVVQDPTFLLTAEDYKKIAEMPTESKPYLFMYILNISTKEEIYWNEVNEYLKKHILELKVVASSGYLPARDLIPGSKNLLATVPQWLGYVHGAACVVTTSFHGVVFCIKMHRPFLAVLLTNEFSAGNARITNLLQTLGLQERIYQPGNNLSEQMDKNIDWVKVNSLLETLRKGSVDFIASNIENV